ncbi:MAG: extracellular solute-binding protein [Deltaproteobacteria bacterium]|nr:extracellular solute-binding protein [Deltaproteobacteria bacterium]
MKRTLVCLMVLGAFLALVAAPVSAETLELITWEGYAPKVLIDKFMQETGIEVKPTYSTNEEMIAKLRATRGAGFDLAQPSQDRISAVQAKYKIYQPIDYSQVKSEQIITSMLEAVKKNTMVDNESYGIPHVYGTSGLIVNRKYAPDAKDYTDLLNPKYKGRVSYRLKRPTLIGLAFAMGNDPFALYSDPKAYKALMDDIGQKMIEGKPLVKLYYDNNDAILQALQSEEVYVAMAWDIGGWKMHAVNPDIDFIAPKSGALGWIDTFAIPAKAKNVAGAYKWINFMMRPENAAVFTNAEKYGTASKGALKFVDEAVKANFTRSFTDADIDNIKWYPTVPAGLEGMEGKILDKVKAAQ